MSTTQILLARLAALGGVIETAALTDEQVRAVALLASRGYVAFGRRNDRPVARLTQVGRKQAAAGRKQLTTATRKPRAGARR